MSRQMISTIFTFVILLFAQNLGAQSQPPAYQATLTGTVLDSLSAKPIPYANVSLTRVRDSEIITGTLTDENGHFSISKIPLGAYQLQVAFIGYKPHKRPLRFSPETGPVQDLGIITLGLTAIQMQAVEVEEDRPILTHTIDRKVFNVEETDLNITAAATDILLQVPSVDVDLDGNVSLRGSENVSVLIDGRPTGLSGDDQAAFLEQLPASTIQSIEVITNPSAKYDPDGMAGIINIVLKRNRLEGLTGNLRTGYGFNDRYQASAQASYRNGNWNLYAMLGLRDDWREMSGETTRDFFLGDSTSTLDQITSGKMSFGSYNAKLGAERNLGEKSKVSFDINFMNRGRTRQEDIHYLQSSLGELFSEYFRESEDEGGGPAVIGNLGFEQQFRHPGRVLKVQLSHNHHWGGHDQTSHQFSPDPLISEYDLDQKSDMDGERNNTILQADYEHPITENSQFEIGYKSILNSIDNERNYYNLVSADEWEIDSLLSNHFIYSEDIHAVYGLYAGTLQQFSYQLGLRLEQVYNNSELLDTDSEYQNDYFSWYPSLHLGYQLSPIDQLQLSYSKRVNRPRTRALIPHEDYSDPLNIRVGNPYLLPEYIHSLELGFSRYRKGFGTSAAIYYKKVDDMMSRIKTVDDRGISTTTFENINSAQSYGLELVQTLSLSQQFRLMLSANLFQTELDASNIEGELISDSFGYFGKVTTIWSVLPKLSIQFSGTYRGPKVIPQGEISSVFFGDLGVKLEMLKKRGTLSINIRDLFDSRKFEFETEGTNYTQSSMRRMGDRTLYVNFAYTFGNLKDKQQKRRSTMDSGDLEEIGNFEID